MHESESDLNKPNVPTDVMRQSDLDHLDARLEQVDARVEISEESQDGIDQASHDALELSDHLGINPNLTDVKLSEIDGEEVEVATSKIGDSSRIEHFITPDSEITVVSISNDTGAAGEKITIKHSTPSEILIGDQPITTAEEAAKVEQVIKELSNEVAEQQGVAEQAAAEQPESEQASGEAETGSEEAPQQGPELSPEENLKLHKQFFQNAIAPYFKAMGPSSAHMLQEMGVTQQDFEGALTNQALKLDKETMEAFQVLMKNGARPDSMIWKENPNAPSALGAAARESRELLKNLWETALRRPKPEQRNR